MDHEFLMPLTACRTMVVCVRPGRCEGAVRVAPTGRWFITMGHAGFNSTANNRDGYSTKEAALRVYRRYSEK